MSDDEQELASMTDDSVPIFLPEDIAEMREVMGMPIQAPAEKENDAWWEKILGAAIIVWLIGHYVMIPIWFLGGIDLSTLFIYSAGPVWVLVGIIFLFVVVALAGMAITVIVNWWNHGRN